MERQDPVAICGMGAVTPFGAGVSSLWRGVVGGRPVLSEMDLFDLGGIVCDRAGVVRGPCAAPPGFRDAPRALRFAAAACLEALDGAGVLGAPALLSGTALATATNFSVLDAGEAALIPPGLPGFRAGAAPLCAPGAPAAALAAGFHLGGVQVPVSLSCASGAAAVAAAADLIQCGAAERVLAVGFDALSRFSWSGLCSLRTMTRGDVRPFDARRCGTVFSEGAAAVVLESAASCAARGRRPLAWLCGWATGNNGYHLTAPAPRGAGSLDVMRAALASGGIDPALVDHINAHGTGTKANDRTEAEAIRDLFGDRAARIPVASVKGALGHTLGAAGIVELVVSALSLQNGVIPPTANFGERDPACPLDVSEAPREMPCACVLSNSAGFGGCNAALAVRKTRPAGGRAGCGPAPGLVLTGAGCVCALGADREEAAAAWREGEPACFPLGRFPFPDAGAPPDAGEALEPELGACGVSPKPYLDPASRFLLAACGQALREAGWDAVALAAAAAGLAAGTAWGCLETSERFFGDYARKGPRLVKPFLFPHTYANTPASLAAMEWSLRGPHGNVTAPGAASGLAFAQAARALRAGRASVMVAAGADALSPTRLRAEAAGHREQTPGEGGAAVVLETEGGARSRGARVLAAVRGLGIARTPGAALDAALGQAGIREGEIAAWLADAAFRRTVEGRVPGAECRAPAELCGDTDGAAFLLQLVLALDGLGQGPAAVGVSGPGASAVCVIAPPARE